MDQIIPNKPNFDNYMLYLNQLLDTLKIKDNNVRQNVPIFRNDHHLLEMFFGGVMEPRCNCFSKEGGEAEEILGPKGSEIGTYVCDNCK